MDFVKLRSDLQNIMDQFKKFRIKYSSLKSKYRDIIKNYHYVTDINHTNTDQITRLKEEIEILRCQLDELEETHHGEIREIQTRNEREKTNYKLTINQLKEKIQELEIAMGNNLKFVHPALCESTAVMKSRYWSKKLHSSVFKWPSSLDIKTSTMHTSVLTSKLLNTKNEKITKGTKKLYSIEDNIVDIAL